MKERQLQFFQFNTTKGISEQKERFILQIPIDTLIIAAIINIFIMVFVFGFGVEQGKRKMLKNTMITQEFPEQTDKKTLLITEKQAENEHLKIAEDSRLKSYAANDSKEENKQSTNQITQPSQPKVAPKTENEPKNISEPNRKKEISVRYVIQLACYTKETIAKAEMNSLKKQGLPVQLVKKGKYLVLYVGEFNTKSEAKELLTKLKNRYTDCFIRSLL